MDIKIIAELVQQIVRQEVLLNYWYWLIMAACAFVGVAVYSFLVPYFRRRGEAYATKADLDAILSQAEKITEATETIKVSISRQDWTHREYVSLRRAKLEELMIAVHELGSWLGKEEQHLFYGRERNDDATPVNIVTTLSGLYFPELKQQVDGLKKAAAAYRLWLLSIGQYRLAQPQTAEGLHAVFEKAKAELAAHYNPLSISKQQLEQAAEALMPKIIQA
jgi:hypothetical protein